MRKKWIPDTNDPLLTDLSGAPHEPPAVRRLQLADWPMGEVRPLMNYTGTRMMRVLEKALDDENAAHERKLPIHTGTAPKGYV